MIAKRIAQKLALEQIPEEAPQPNMSELAERIELSIKPVRRLLKELTPVQLLGLRQALEARKLQDPQPINWNWSSFPAGRTRWKSWSRRSLKRNRAIKEIQSIIKNSR